MNSKITLGLEREFFHSVELFQRELDRIFSRFWKYVDHLGKFPTSENIHLVNIADEDLIFAVQESGEILAFRNHCRHRGLRLCGSESGTTSSTRRSMRCPYHGWTYSMAGDLIAAPNMQDVDGFDCSDFSLHRVFVETWNGLVFINGSTNTESLNQFMAPLQTLLDGLPVDELRVVRELEYVVGSNWKILFQNYSECYHCPSVHPQLNQLSPFDSAENDLNEGPILGGPMKLVNCDSMTTDGRFCANPFYEAGDQRRKRVSYFTIFPSLFFSPHPDYLLLHRIEPLDVQTTRVTCQFLIAGEVNESRIDSAAQFWDQTNRQDWTMCERAQKGTRSRSYRPGPYSTYESVLPAFDRFYRESLFA